MQQESMIRLLFRIDPLFLFRHLVYLYKFNSFLVFLLIWLSWKFMIVYKNIVFHDIVIFMVELIYFLITSSYKWGKMGWDAKKQASSKRYQVEFENGLLFTN